MIRHTLISVGPPEDRRPFISGILMEYEAGTLNLVSTDGNSFGGLYQGSGFPPVKREEEGRRG